MIKNLAVFLAVVLVLIIFQPQIKAAVAHARFSVILSGLEVEPEQDEALRDIRERLGDGYRQRAFTDQERMTVAELRAELATLAKQDAAPPTRSIDLLIGQFEAILARHKL